MKLVKKIALFEKCENEIKISEKIREIPYFFLYFSPVKTHVFLKISEIHEYFLESSEILENKDYVIISKEPPLYPTFHIFFENLINPKEKIRFLLDSYVYLLKTIDILNSNGIIYLGLNSEKVGFTQKKQPILYDFSKSFFVNEKFNILTTYEPASFTIPLETHILTFMNYKLRDNERVSQTNIENVCKDFIVKNQAIRGFPDEFIKSYFTSCVLQALAFSIVNEDKEKVFEKLVKYAKTWDNYSLSALFLPMIRQIQIEEQFKPFFEGFSELLLLNMSPDPEKRLTPKKTIEKFEDLFVIHSTF